MLAVGCVSGYRNALLTQVDDLPCFAVEDTFANRQNPPLLRALVVEDAEEKPPKRVWSFAIPKGSQPLMLPGKCVPYGRLPAGAEITTAAAKLAFGKSYEADINALAENSTGGRHLHVVKFCLIKDANGATKVHEIKWDKTQERWRYDICKQ